MKKITKIIFLASLAFALILPFQKIMAKDGGSDDSSVFTNINSSDGGHGSDSNSNRDEIRIENASGTIRLRLEERNNNEHLLNATRTDEDFEEFESPVATSSISTSSVSITQRMNLLNLLQMLENLISRLTH